MKMWWTSAVCLVPLLLVQAARAEIYTSLTCMSNLFSFDKMVGEALPLMPEFTPEIEGVSYSESSQRTGCRWKRSHELDLTLTGEILCHIFALVKRLRPLLAQQSLGNFTLSPMRKHARTSATTAKGGRRQENAK
ncbi:hypothetical protein C7M84_023862 [Penaeus vannamei]|uniref:Uncharacterized protein n=1 Tax=Penaeus vannamei TaxID=6689 RepID=A0A3R7QY89_PENVA|nr:hypothetical protein C7M84_023862 [Penaeus vannamei]